MSHRIEPHGSRIAFAYFVYFAALGAAGPFLALVLERRGLRASEVAYVLALLPITRVLSTPGWTLLADRLQSAGAVLRLVAVGALVSFAALEFRVSQPGLVVALMIFTAFRAPVTALIDVLALQWSGRTGGEFGQLRAWGTAGFLVATMLTGFLVSRLGATVIVHVTVVLLAATALSTYALQRGAAPERVGWLGALSVLLRRPRYVLFLVTAGLHQLGLAAYDGLFAAYMTHRSSATAAGMAVGWGAIAEVIYMTRGHRLLRALGRGNILAVSYAVSAVRWWIVATTTSSAVLIAVQGLHAFTFGAFYLAGVELVDAESPPEVRASAQGVFSAFTWGVAATASLSLAGSLERHGGTSAVFMVGAAGASVASAIAVAMARMKTRGVLR